MVGETEYAFPTELLREFSARHNSPIPGLDSDNCLLSELNQTDQFALPVEFLETSAVINSSIQEGLCESSEYYLFLV